MAISPRQIFLFFRRRSDRQLRQQLTHLLGFAPRRLSFYEMAFTHRSRPDAPTENNERLEFLGDAVLGAVVAEYLFKKYPYQPEGFLTEVRSRMVRRESLNTVAMQMGLNKLIQYNKNDRALGSSHIFGNALEALIGAVYLDAGYERTRTFVLRQVVRGHMDIETLATTDTNYKNQILSWGQKKGHVITYEDLPQRTTGARRVFAMGILVDGQQVATGTGYTKKEAGQAASKAAIDKLEIEAAKG